MSRKSPDGYVTYEDCKCIAESEKALLIECEDWDGQQWIPKTQVHDDSECYEKGTDGTLVVSLWIAQQKGLPT